MTTHDAVMATVRVRSGANVSVERVGWERRARAGVRRRAKGGDAGDGVDGNGRPRVEVDLDDARVDSMLAPRRGARGRGVRWMMTRVAASIDRSRRVIRRGRLTRTRECMAETLERVATSAEASAREPNGGVWTPPDLVDLGGKSARQWSPIALAFLGDAVFEMYARGVLFYPPSKPLEYDLKTKRVARAEAQDFLLRLLVSEGTLNEEETSIVKWGRNAAYGNIPTRLKGKGKGGHGTYRNASALECLIGFLYVTDRARLEQVMGVIMSETALASVLELK